MELYCITIRGTLAKGYLIVSIRASDGQLTATVRLPQANLNAVLPHIKRLKKTSPIKTDNSKPQPEAIIVVRLPVEDIVVAEVYIRDIFASCEPGPSLWEFDVPLPGDKVETLLVADTYQTPLHDIVEVSSRNFPFTQPRIEAFRKALGVRNPLCVMFQVEGSTVKLTLSQGATLDRARSFEEIASLVPPLHTTS